MDELVIANKKINSRFFVGTGKFTSNKIIPEVLKSSEAQVVTVAMRRIDIHSTDSDDNILNFINKDCILVANTSGARNAEEAIRLAHISKAMGCGNWIKIEVIPDNKYLLPDNYETIKAAKTLVKEGFVVLPYINPDLMDAKRLVDAGASAVMPLGAPIGTNRGLKTKELLRILIDEIDIPIVVDAGIGKPSHAAEAMEMGADAVLANTALAAAENPVLIAEAFKLAVQAGRKAFLAKPGIEMEFAAPSSPLTGFLR